MTKARDNESRWEGAHAVKQKRGIPPLKNNDQLAEAYERSYRLSQSGWKPARRTGLDILRKVTN